MTDPINAISSALRTVADAFMVLAAALDEPKQDRTESAAARPPGRQGRASVIMAFVRAEITAGRMRHSPHWRDVRASAEELLRRNGTQAAAGRMAGLGKVAMSSALRQPERAANLTRLQVIGAAELLRQGRLEPMAGEIAAAGNRLLAKAGGSHRGG